MLHSDAFSATYLEIYFFSSFGILTLFTLFPSVFIEKMTKWVLSVNHNLNNCFLNNWVKFRMFK